MEAKKKIAIMGGSFDPPTISHQMMAQVAYAESKIDGLSVMPSYNHRAKSNRVSYEDRIRLCQIAFEPLGFRVSDWESKHESGAMFDTLNLLVERHPQYEYYCLIGLDCAMDIENGLWHKGNEIIEKYPFIITPRPGVDLGKSDIPRWWNLDPKHQYLDTLIYDCSSTEVRNAMTQGDIEHAKRRVPPKVWEDIEKRGLYR